MFELYVDEALELMRIVRIREMRRALDVLDPKARTEREMNALRQSIETDMAAMQGRPDPHAIDPALRTEMEKRRREQLIARVGRERALRALGEE